MNVDWVMSIGFIAATLTTISFVPQVIKSWKTKSTGDVSLIMYSMLVTGILLWLVYGLLSKDMPLILANGFGLILTSSVLILKLRNG